MRLSNLDRVFVALHSRVNGQDDGKGRPCTRLAGDFNVPVVGVYDGLGNRQTQPEATSRTGAGGAVETFNRLWEVLRCCRTVSVQDYTNISRCCLRCRRGPGRHSPFWGAKPGAALPAL
jgi:hypothetical protein